MRLKDAPACCCCCCLLLLPEHKLRRHVSDNPRFCFRARSTQAQKKSIARVRVSSILLRIARRTHKQAHPLHLPVDSSSCSLSLPPRPLLLFAQHSRSHKRART